MRRAFVVLSIAAGLTVASWAAPASKSSPSLSKKLSQRVAYNGIDDPKATLNEALGMIANRYDIRFDINEKAFRFENIQEVGKAEIAVPNPIPAMRNARLSTILRKILSRLPVPSGATYLVRSDHIEITTGTFKATEIWGRYTGPHLPLVNVTFEKCPLADALGELGDLSGFSIVLDNRAAEQGKTPVSARLLNTPLDTALRLLADMTDLRSVHIDNVLYVTTKENAAALEARLEKEKTPTQPLSDEDGGVYRTRKGSGPGNLVISPLGD